MKALALLLLLSGVALLRSTTAFCEFDLAKFRSAIKACVESVKGQYAPQFDAFYDAKHGIMYDFATEATELAKFQFKKCMNEHGYAPPKPKPKQTE